MNGPNASINDVSDAIMDLTEEKPLEIAARMKLTFDSKAWTVPSQTGGGACRVRLRPEGQHLHLRRLRPVGEGLQTHPRRPTCSGARAAQQGPGHRHRRAAEEADLFGAPAALQSHADGGEAPLSGSLARPLPEHRGAPADQPG